MRTPIATETTDRHPATKFARSKRRREAANHRRIISARAAGCKSPPAPSGEKRLGKGARAPLDRGQGDHRPKRLPGPCSAGPVLKIGEVLYESVKPQTPRKSSPSTSCAAAWCKG